MRIALGLEYLGTKFHGWQCQPTVATIQKTLEDALSKVADEPIRITAAGRTDTGVHATHQVVHFDTHVVRSLDAWILGSNSHLPASISVHWAKCVEDDFHARFSALSRRYQYVIYNKAERSSLLANLTTWVYNELNVVNMNMAAQSLLGEHDFSAYRSMECQSRSSKRYVFAIRVIQRQQLVIVDITANSFLHHMVRNIVGVLLEIGKGRQSPDWCEEVLVAKDRNMAAKTAPPHGLYLVGVKYADSPALPTDYRPPFFIEW